jgi:hypothetical protein
MFDFNHFLLLLCLIVGWVVVSIGLGWLHCS